MLRPGEVVALVTAAGASSRMGTPKALLDWGGRPLVAHQAAVLGDLADVVVVVGADADAIRAAAPLASPARYVENPAWAEGRSTSVEVGARALADALTDSPPRGRGRGGQGERRGRGGGNWRAVLVVAVDQPLERPVVEALFAAFDPARHAIAQPTHEGRRGHPLLLAARALPELRAASAHPEGLRDVVRALAAGGEALLVPVASAAIHGDLNTPERYAAARPGSPPVTPRGGG